MTECPQRPQYINISFIFASGHTDVMGNKRLDLFAGTATTSDGQAVDGADITNVLR